MMLLTIEYNVFASRNNSDPCNVALLKDEGI